MNYKLKLMYEGTNYAGWQRQQNARTIQGELECALSVITREKISTVGVSRTDAGVHAAEYTANFHSQKELDTRKLCRGVNALMPEDIRLLSADICSDIFNSRFDAVKKTYLYRIDLSHYGNVFHRNISWHLPHNLDIDKMQEAAHHFLGMHDFTAFMAQGGSSKTFERNIMESELFLDGSILTYRITGNGFLYNMVRIIVGTLAAVGKGKILAEDIPKIILSKDRTKAGMTAPAKGLTLFKAEYPNEN